MSIRSSLFRYGAAIAVNAIALVITHLSWEWNGVHHASFALLSIIVSTLSASFKSALLAVALNVIVVHNLLTSLHECGAFTELLRRSTFAAAAVLLAVLVSARRRVRKDGSRFRASSIVSAVKRGTGELRGFVKVMRDTTGRKMAAAERETLLHRLAAERANLKAILHQMPVGVVIAEAPSGNPTLINKQVRQMFGDGFVTPEALGRYDEWNGFHADGQRYTSEAWPLARSVKACQTVLGEEIHILRADGESRTLSVSAAPLYDIRRRIIAGMMTMQDVTEHRLAKEALQKAHDELEQRARARTEDLARANEALRQEIGERRAADEARGYLLQRLDRAQEEERLHISHELHDQIGQHLTALMVGLDLLQPGVCEPALLSGRLQSLRNLVEEMAEDLHRLIHQMRPSALDELGLETALAGYAGEWSEMADVPVDFHSDGIDKHQLAPQVELTIYRIVQEALTNVLKHARATSVSLIIECRDDHVHTIVEDDGHGFDVEAVMKRRGVKSRLGLLGMRERIALVNGTLNIESRPSAGTTVFAKIPFQTGDEGGGEE